MVSISLIAMWKLLPKKKYKLAAKYLRSLISSKRYGETKVAQRAEKKLDAIAGFL